MHLSIISMSWKYKIILFGFLLVTALLFSGNQASAATFNVASGTDQVSVDSSCSLSEAIENINDQAQTNADCAAGDGLEDAINIPAGTLTLSADIPTITESVVINGAGIDQTIVNGDSGQYKGFEVEADVDFEIHHMMITAYKHYAVNADAQTIVVTNIEVDGTDSTIEDGELAGVIALGRENIDSSINIQNVDIHDLEASSTIIHGIGLGNRATGSSTEIELSNVTVARLTNNSASGSINAFLFSIGAFGLNGGGGSIEATVSNVTITEVVANGAGGSASGFGGFGMASSGNTDIVIDARNVTVTGIRGNTSAYGDTAVFFSAGAGIGVGDVASTTLNATNSLLADNLNNGASSNCKTLDVSGVFAGSGSADVEINSLGHNLSDDNTCTSFIAEGDMQNMANILSTLGPLQDNGGPVQTRALLPGSPAIGAGGVVLGITTDARGVARNPSSWDVGAYQSVLGDSTDDSEPVSATYDKGNLADTGQDTSLSFWFGISLIVSVAGLFLRRLAFNLQ